MSTITKKQRAILDFIESFVDEKHYNPTFQEIADGLGLKSLSTVHKHLTNLQNQGFIKRDAHKARSMEVTEPDPVGSRFRFEGPERLWDTLAGCYWVKEKKR